MQDLPFGILYGDEKKMVTNELSYGLYALRNRKEYFAEIFAVMYTSPKSKKS